MFNIMKNCFGRNLLLGGIGLLLTGCSLNGHESTTDMPENMIFSGKKQDSAKPAEVSANAAIALNVSQVQHLMVEKIRYQFWIEDVDRAIDELKVECESYDILKG